MPPTKFTIPNQGEIARSRADITKIRNLGWEPKVSLQDGVKMTLDAIGFKQFV